ncbi:T-box transcription factor TBX22 [Oryzias melastigma]|uniref:T-box transcription factor TBX22 n=1 Tax=Oryzias melastigma TaxID=30732 RepID=A0A834BV46_ORYME|nr:T-box transcription factor TBX22 [Oryzias melastigma]
MQGLSSRAHAFSVEALVGKPCKRMKVSERTGSSSDGDADGTDQHSTKQTQKADSALRRPDDTSIDPPGQTDRPASENSEPTSQDSNCRSDREVRVELQGSELWKRFYEIGTEMIITKAGRRMFPSVRVKVRNLEPCQQYYIAMDVMPVDSKRYRYVYHSSQWMVAGNTDHSCISPRLYVHPDSPCTGETWMRQVISFDRVKLTNNEMDDKGHVEISISRSSCSRCISTSRVCTSSGTTRGWTCLRSGPCLPEGVHSFSFLETEFTTVTAYQNQQITKLKIDRNPFAKGFRDPGRNRGVLDGLLESYPWRGPLSLDLKPFAIQLQGSSGSGGVKSLFPLSSSPALLPHFGLSCQDAALHTLALPLYGKATGVSTPGGEAFLHAEKQRSFPLLPPLSDLPLLSALQGRKPCPHRPPGSLPPLYSSHFLPDLAEASGSYCLYRYSLPLSPQLISRHPKLAEDTSDSLLRQFPWQLTTNHCL